MNSFSILLLSLLFFFQAFANPNEELKLPTAQNYESGRFLCTEKYKALVEHEKGFYIPVPYDYRKPESGKTEIYAFWSGSYDPKKKTLIYFTGGPGQTSHWGLFKFETEFNVLMMDQRGIGCSRPAAVEQYLSPDFYSSENVARDAEEIRRSLKLDQVTVYGISYGTIPATMFASLFPKSTRALILEGVVFSVEDQLWEAPHRRKLLQRMINSLPAEIKEKMASISSVHGLPDVWLSNIGRDEMLHAFGIRKLKAKLMELSDEVKFNEFVQMLKSYYTPMQYEPHVLFALNQIPYMMISCQEMGLDSDQVSTEDSLVGGQLVPKINPIYRSQCQKLKATAKEPYSALRYPVQVPVTYFQGADDSATPAPQGIHHYKNVPRGPKQLLILREGGHNPNLQLVNLEYEEQIQIFNLAVAGEKISASLIEKFNRSQDEYSWAFTSK